jgi:hypothetical protein
VSERVGEEILAPRVDAGERVEDGGNDFVRSVLARDRRERIRRGRGRLRDLLLRRWWRATRNRGARGGRRRWLRRTRNRGARGGRRRWRWGGRAHGSGRRHRRRSRRRHRGGRRRPAGRCRRSRCRRRGGRRCRRGRRRRGSRPMRLERAHQLLELRHLRAIARLRRSLPRQLQTLDQYLARLLISAGSAGDRAYASEIARSSAFSRSRIAADRPGSRPSATSAASIAAGMPAIESLSACRMRQSRHDQKADRPRCASPDLGAGDEADRLAPGEHPEACDARGAGGRQAVGGPLDSE